MSAELRDAQEGPFEDWWNREGQYLRAGGDSYSKTFAWHAWCEATGRAQAPAAEPQWQPIETAPKDGSLFLCWVSAVSYGETDEGQQYQQDVSQVDFCQWHGFEEAPNGGWFEPCCGRISDSQDVTHWMPIPPAPEFNPQPADK